MRMLGRFRPRHTCEGPCCGSQDDARRRRRRAGQRETIGEIRAQLADGFPLAPELAAFENYRASALALGLDGKWALVRNFAVVAICDTEQSATESGYRQFGNVPFLVKQIKPADVPVYFPGAAAEGCCRNERGQDGG